MIKIPTVSVTVCKQSLILGLSKAIRYANPNPSQVMVSLLNGLSWTEQA